MYTPILKTAMANSNFSAMSSNDLKETHYVDAVCDNGIKYKKHRFSVSHLTVDPGHHDIRDPGVREGIQINMEQQGIMKARGVLMRAFTGDVEDITDQDVTDFIGPVGDDLRRNVLERQHVKKELNRMRKLTRKHEDLAKQDRREFEELTDFSERKEFCEVRRHAARTRLVERARLDAHLTRIYQKRHIESRRKMQHDRRSERNENRLDIISNSISLDPQCEQIEDDNPITMEAHASMSSQLRGAYLSMKKLHDIASRFTVPLPTKLKNSITTVFDVVSFIILGLKAKSMIEVIAACHLFSRARNFGIYEQTLVSTLVSVVHKIRNSLSEKDRKQEIIKLEAQSLSDEIRDVAGNVGTYLNCVTVDAIKKLVALVVGLEYFQDKDTAFQVYKWIPRIVYPNTTWPEMIEMGLNCVATIVRVGELIFQGVPLSEALFADDPLKALIKEAEELIVKEKFVYIGLPIEGYIEQTVYNARVSTAVSSLQTFVKKMNSNQRKACKVDEYLAKLTIIHLKLKTSGKGKTRKAPLGIVLHGASSIGKSMLLKYMAKLHCDVVKRPYSPELIYQKNDEPYWNGFSPASNPYIQFPEVGCLHQNIAAKMGDPVVKMLLSLIDTNPFNCQMADVDSKGEIYANPQLILIDTNVDHMNLGVSFNNPAAFERRFVYVYIRVKPEFQRAGSPSVDPAKVAAAGINKLDIYEFEIYARYPADAESRKSHRATILKTSCIHEFSDKMRTIMALHEAAQERFISNDHMSGLGNCGYDSVEASKIDNTPLPKKHQSVKDKIEKFGLRTMSHLHKAMYKTQEKVFEYFYDDSEDFDLDAELEDEKKKRKCIIEVFKDTEKSFRKINEGFKKFDDQMRDMVEERFWELKRNPKCSLLKSTYNFLYANCSLDAAQAFLYRFATFDDSGKRIPHPDSDIDAFMCMCGLFYKDDESKYKDIPWLRPKTRDVPTPDIEMINMGVSEIKEEMNPIASISDSKSESGPDILHTPRARNSFDYFDDDDANLSFDLFPDENYLHDIDLDSDVEVPLDPNCSNCKWFGVVPAPHNYTCSPGTPLGDNHWVEEKGYKYPRALHRVVRAASPLAEEVKPVRYDVKVNESFRPEHDLRVSIRYTVDLLKSELKLWFARRFIQYDNQSFMIRCLLLLLSFVLLFFNYTRFITYIIVILALTLDFGKMIENRAKQGIRSAFIPENPIEKAQAEVDRAKKMLESYHSGDVNWWCVMPLVLCVSGVIGAVLYAWRNETPIFKEAQSTIFSVDDEMNKKLNSTEDSMEAKPPSDRIVNKILPDIWNRKYPLRRCSYTEGLQGFNTLVQRNVRMALYAGSIVNKSRIYMLKSNIAVLCGHAITYDSEGFMSLKISTTGDLANDRVKKITKLRKEDIVQLKDDLYIAYVDLENVSDMTNHIWPEATFQSSYVGVFMGDIVEIMYRRDGAKKLDVKHPVTKEQIAKSDIWLYSSDKCGVGVCVEPLIAQRDNGCCIAGFHFAGANGTGAAHCVVLDDVKEALAKLEKTTTLMPHSSCGDFHQLPILSDEPHGKSFMRYEILHGIEYFGSIPNFGSVNNKSQVKSTGFNKDGSVDLLLLEEFSYIGDTEYGAPLMRERKNPYINPWNVNIINISQERAPLDRRIIEKCVAAYVGNIISHVGERCIKPWDIDSAINGAINDSILKRIDASKSAGFGHPGCKGDYLVLTNGTRREPVSKIKEELQIYFEIMDTGRSPGAIFTGQLKDEARDVKKIADGKTRLFCVSEITYLIAARMICGPLFTLMMEHNLAFRTALGVDMHRSGVRVFHELEEFSDQCWEGDYSKFDQMIPFSISWGATSVFYDLAKHYGYNEIALKRLQAILTDSLFPVLVVNGDVIRCPGFTPSGMYDTVVFNSVKNNLMKMYFVEYVTKDVSLYFTHIKGYVVGDDTIDAVKPELSHFYNGVGYQKFCKDHFYMKFTPTDKDGEMSAFVPKGDLTFLKRRKRYSPILERDCAQIDLDSCRKTLMWNIPSGIIDPWNQNLQACESVLVELFQYCQSIQQFNRVRDSIALMLSKKYGMELSQVRKKFKTARQIKDSLNRDVPGYVCDDDNVVEDEVLLLQAHSWSCSSTSGEDRRPFEDGRRDIARFIYTYPNYSTGLGMHVKAIGWSGNARTKNEIVQWVCEGICRPEAHTWQSVFHQFKSLDETISELEEQLQNIVHVENPVPTMSAGELYHHPCYTGDSDFKIEVDKYLSYLGRIESIKTTLAMMRKEPALILKPHSENWTTNDGPVSTDEKISQNLTTMGGQETRVSSAGDAPLLKQVWFDTWDNGEFMKRPVYLTSGTWNINTTLSFALEPWKLFLADPAVRSKIRNQWLLNHANLKVRFTFSGTPFHQGRTQLAYVPLAYSHPVARRYISTMPTISVDYSRLVYFSQMKGVQYADPSDNQPYDISCPLAKFQPALRFNGEDDGTAIGSALEFKDFKNQGHLTIISFDELEAVTETPTNVTFNIYAWMEDVDMGVDTGTKMILQPNSEQYTGPLERTAMAAASVANSLSSVPYIGEHAKAGEMIFNGMGKLASLFGLSRPNIATEPHRFKNEPFQNASTVIGSETGHKINLDPLSELALTNTFDGTDEDEMSFRYIYEKESYITTIDWRTDSAIMTPIFYYGVSPSTLPAESIVEAIPSQVNCQPTPAGFLSTFFNNWRGTLCLRLDFVKTKFHAGSIGIMYEPNAYQKPLITAGGIHLNVEKVLIIDLKEVTSIELEIYWNQGTYYLPTMFDDPPGASSIFGPNPDLNTFAKFLNGYITVFPITTLQAPLAKSVHMLVFAKWKDLQFNAYTTNQDQTYTSMKWNIDSEEKINLEPNSQEVYSLNKAVPMPNDLNELVFAEKPTSWRSLLKRYCTMVIVGAIPSQADQIWNGYQTIIPYPSINIDDTLPEGEKYEEAFDRTRLCYLGMRGSHKYRITQAPYSLSGDMENLTVGLAYVSDTPDASGWGLDFRDDGPADAFYWGFNGFTMFIPKTQGGIEFQVPMYTNNLAAQAASIDPYDTTYVKHIDPKCYRAFTAQWPVHITNIVSGKKNYVYLQHAIGDDFTFMRFMGAPPFVHT